MLQRIVLSLFLTFVIIYAAALFISEKLDVVAQIEIAAPPATIYPQIANLDQWHRWNQFTQNENITKTMNDNGELVGIAGSDKRGNTIIIARLEATPNEKVIVNYNYKIDGLDILTTTSFLLEGIGTENSPKTLVQWKYQGDYTNLIGMFKVKRLLLLFSTWMIKREMNSSLEKLSSLNKKRKETPNE